MLPVILTDFLSPEFLLIMVIGAFIEEQFIPFNVTAWAVTLLHVI